VNDLSTNHAPFADVHYPLTTSFLGNVKRTSVIIMVCLVFAPVLLNAQWAGPFPEGLGIEIGGGHNQLLWHVNAEPPFVTASDHPREELSFTPTVRLTYELSPFEDAQLLPFVGYDKFGGKSGEDPDGYKDEYWISAVDVGVLAAYRAGQFTFGPGLKYNRLIKETVRSYMAPTGQTSPRRWVEDDASFFFKNFSYDVGARVSLEVSHWSVSGEAWFGITRMEKGEFDNLLDIRENHFKILVGYRL